MDALRHEAKEVERRAIIWFNVRMLGVESSFFIITLELCKCEPGYK